MAEVPGIPRHLGLRPRFASRCLLWFGTKRDGPEPLAMLLLPSGTERISPFNELGVRGGWSELIVCMGHASSAQSLGPVPWVGWGYFWDWAGALGLVSDVPM